MTELSDLSKKWLKNAKFRSERLDIDFLTRACTFTESFNEKIKTPFADSILDQGLAIAEELLALDADNETLVAAITYPAVYYGQINRETIEKQLGKNVYKILSSTQHIESVQALLKTTSQKKIDNLRKMLLAIVDDARTVLIKFAECLVILKYFRQHDTKERKAIAQQTQNLYAPLANRLGIGQLKWQLEDLAFRFTDEEKYAEIKKALNMRRADREKYIETMIQQLSALFEQASIEKLEINGRAKHIFSIHRKMQKKNIPFEELYDTFALRILVPEIQDCYKVLGLIHAEWSPIQKEFDDYIANPKPNGYQSIHTAIKGPSDMNIEIQIRTHQMHEESELGVAAHWKYKEGGKQSNYEEKINRLRELMEWQKTEAADEEGENLYSKVFEDQIYVFTPAGDVFDFNAGATPLDFAYTLHTEVGHRCRGAKVNGALVPLTHKLQTGDRIEIITSKESKPSRDWLKRDAGYITTHSAKHKIRHWFKKANYEIDQEQGSVIWEKNYRRGGLKKSDISKAYKRFHFKTLNDLLAAIGSHQIGIVTVLNYLKGEPTAAVSKSIGITISKQVAIEKKASSGLVIEGVGNLLTTTAQCCKPIPGDPIVGYVTRGRGVTIHHKNCPDMLQSTQHRQERVLKVQWGEKQSEAYPVNISIEAHDRTGLLHDISSLTTHEKIPIISIQSHLDAIKDRAYINLTVEVTRLSLLDKLLTQLRNIAAVISVKRE